MVQYVVPLVLTHWDINRIENILQMTFSNVFSWKKIFVFWFKFHCFFPKGLIDSKLALVQVIGLRPRRCQAITWTNVYQAVWYHMVSLGHVNKIKFVSQ